MKQGAIVMVCILLAQSAFGLILLDNTESNTYNLGDDIKISGYIIQDKDLRGKFQLELQCQEKIPLLIRYLTLRRGEKLDIKENLAVPLSMKGDCAVIASIISDNILVEQAKTNNFKITEELNGTFSLENNLIQLGKPLELKGKVQKLNGDVLNGIATIYLLSNNEINLIEAVELTEGILDYTYDTINNLPGDYTINIEVNDVYGNKALFTNVVKFTIINEISVFAETNKESALPGTTITVFGSANTILKESIEGGTATIAIEGQTYTANVRRNGQFDLKIDLSENIKSGKLNIRVTVDDEAGNTGDTETSVEVIPVPTYIEIEVEESVFKPEEEISIKPLLFDQASDLLEELVNIEIKDNNGKTVFQDSVKSGAPISYLLPQGASPGVWKVIAYTTKLRSEANLYVGQLYSLDFRLENETLVILNTGNIKYTEPIEIRLTGAETSSIVTKKTSILPDNELRINLAREVKPGVYDVEIKDKKFENVRLTSRGINLNTNFIYWSLVIIVIVLLIYLAFFRTKRRLIKKLRKLREIKKLHKHHPKDNIDDVNVQFRNQLLKQVESRDRKIKENLKFNLKKERKTGKGFIVLGKKQIMKEKQREEESKKGGLFSMFD